MQLGLRCLFSVTFVCGLLAASHAFAQEIANPGFESGWQGWTDADPSGKGTALSDVANSGEQAVKLSEASVYVSQVVYVEPNTAYELSAQIRGAGNLGVKVGSEIFFEQKATKSKKKWEPIRVTFQSGEASSVTIFASFAGREGRFDDFSLSPVDDSSVQISARIIPRSAGGYGLSPDLPPGRNFDLLGWYLNTPADDNGDGVSDRFPEVELAKGFEDKRYFYTGDDGGMVFRATTGGAKTSKNTRFTRTELREMLRRGNTDISTRNEDRSPNKNNWVFSSAPEKAQRKAGAIDGSLRATLAVNKVTSTGDDRYMGRVIIGQIHASSDEPARLYYHKLPGNSRGSLYVAHEIADGDDVFYELLGSRLKNAADPEDGIALDEKFSYEITARGNSLYVSISQEGEMRAEVTIDMSKSGYDVANEYMYFKAGAYNQNNSGNPEDYAQVTFYELAASH
ncbi:MAG: polysaccharide lyase family 7 protein [Xanthomonadales bacterium]|nr:polysaccharide lyase family 7 protein [Xanthomonadales bacterium]